MTKLSDLAAFLKAHDDYCLFGHIHPDGDTAGSCIALALALKALGKRAFVYLPQNLPMMYRAFRRSVEVAFDAHLPFAPKTAFAVDVSEYRRLDSGRALFDSCEHSCMLDHHGTNSGFGEVWFVDGFAAATGELALELIDLLGVEMTAEMAEWLFIALSTDSGQFSFSSTRAETMRAAARCIEAGADVDHISQVIFRTRSEGRTRLMGKALSVFEMNSEKTMAWAVLREDDYAALGALREDNENIVNYLLEIRGVEFSMLAEELDGKAKVSLRSRGKINVAEIAGALGGGGHALAAGVTLDLPMDEALALLRERAEKALKESGEA